MFIDTCLHQEKFITANGVKLHYLDWAGTGPSLLFLPGLGDSAHVFDDLAPQFTAHFRVLGLTRRGQGESEKTIAGYDTNTLSEDIRHFLRSLAIERVILVGHSLAGDEITHFAAQYPEIVEKLIYLDANYDAANDSELGALLPISYPSPSAQDLQSLTAYRTWLKKNMFGGVWSEALEANLYSTLEVAADDTFKERMPSHIANALIEGRTGYIDYTAIQAPVLAFFAIKERFPGLEDHNAATQTSVQNWVREVAIPFLNKTVKHFTEQLPYATVVELADTNHYLFIDRQATVFREMLSFLITH